MNARLLIRLLHRPVLVPSLVGLHGALPPERVLPRHVPERVPAAPPAERKPPPVQLLGHGHDALLVQYRRGMPQSPNAEERLLRYVRALYCRDMDNLDTRMEGLRRDIGQQFQMAWARGSRPDLRHGTPALRIHTHKPTRGTP